MRVEYVKDSYGGAAMLVWKGDILLDEKTYERWELYKLPDDVRNAFGVSVEDGE